MHIRNLIGQAEVLGEQARRSRAEADASPTPPGEAAAGRQQHGVVIGISPAFGLQLFLTTGG